MAGDQGRVRARPQPAQSSVSTPNPAVGPSAQDPAFQPQSQGQDTPMLDAAQAELGPDARDHYEHSETPTLRLSPEEVAAVQDTPLDDVMRMVGGDMEDRRDMAEDVSANVFALRSQVQANQSLSFTSWVMEHFGIEDRDVALARIESAIADSGALSVDLDQFVADVDQWLGRSDTPQEVMEELLARYTLLMSRSRPVIAELTPMASQSDPAADANDQQAVRLATRYEAIWSATEAYNRPFREAMGDVREAVDLMEFTAEVHDISSKILFIRGASGMSAKWKLAAAGKAAELPGAVAAMDAIDWDRIGVAFATAQGYEECVDSAETELELQVCGDMAVGDMEAWYGEMVDISEDLITLAER